MCFMNMMNTQHQRDKYFRVFWDLNLNFTIFLFKKKIRLLKNNNNNDNIVDE